MKPNTVGRVVTQTGETAQSPYPMAGLVAGTLILTGDGALPIEFLTPGDRIISRSHGMVRLTGVEACTDNTHLVRVTAGALGADVPERPTMMPYAQRVLLRDPQRANAFSQASQVVLPVGCLVNDGDIKDLGIRETRLFRLHFDRPEVIYADGIEIAISAHSELSVQAA